MSKGRFLGPACLVFLISCSSMQSRTFSRSLAFDDLQNSNLGASTDEVLKALGKPSSMSNSTVGSLTFENWIYRTSDGKELGYLMVESDRVIGRYIFIFGGQKEENPDVAKARFPNAHFDEFRACDQHWGGRYKVDEKEGLFVGINQFGTFAVAWADPNLTKNWITELKDKCNKGGL